MASSGAIFDSLKEIYNVAVFTTSWHNIRDVLHDLVPFVQLKNT